ncbi:MAG: PEP-CTERM sorting domain-containing protein [Candidatus Korobacteraceae bacterium]
MGAKLVRILLAVAVIGFGTALLAQVQNGGFETGDFSGWTLSSDTTLVGVCSTNCPGIAPYDGTYAAYFGPVGDTATLSQTIPTTPGTPYSLDFFLANPSGGTPNYFNVTFGTASFSFTNFGAAFSWQEFSLTDTPTSSQTEISFTFQNDPAYWLLDDASVSSQGVAPEPGTFVLFGTGLVGIAALVRRKLRS